MILNAISSPDDISLNQILINSSQELFGEREINAQFNQSEHPPEDAALQSIEDFQNYLQNQFGFTGARGAAVLTGRCVFNTLLRYSGEALGWFERSFSMQPAQRRFKVGLRSLAEKWGKMNQEEIHLEETDDCWLWKHNFSNLHAVSKSASCDVTVGLLQEFTRWVSGGKFFDIQELSPTIDEKSIRVIKISKRALE